MLIMVVFVVCAALLLVLGLFLRKGKGLLLLAGYNTLPKELQDKTDKVALAKLASHLLLRMSLYFLCLGVALYFRVTLLAVGLILVFTVDTLLSIMAMNRITPRAKPKKATVVMVSVLTALVLVLVGWMIYYGEQEPVVVVVGNAIKIESMYGLEVDLANVEKISLLDTNMLNIGIGSRNNGYGGFGNTLKGHFSSQANGKYILFVQADSNPIVWIQRGELEDIYISYRDSGKTQALYDELMASFLPGK